MTVDEARVRLEGALELVEAGAERYRSAVHHLADVHTARADLERLISAEQPLDEATAQVALRVARGGPPELQRALDSTVDARRHLRALLTQRLSRLGIEPFMRTLAQEVQLLLDNTLPPLELPPVAHFDIAPRLNRGLAAACGFSGLLFLFVLGFAPQLAWVSILIHLGAIGTAIWSSRRKLDVHSDRVRLVPRIGRVLELPLKSARVLGALKPATQFEQDHLATLIELLQHPVFSQAGRASDEKVYEAESNSSDESVAALVGEQDALIITNKDEDTLNAAVGQRCSWTQPRAWLVAHLLARLPSHERDRVITRLTVAGLARTLPSDEFHRTFTILW